MTYDALKRASDAVATVLDALDVTVHKPIQGDAIHKVIARAVLEVLPVPAPAVDREGLSSDIVTEHAIEMSGGGMHVRYEDPEIERIYPLAQWIPDRQRFGGKVWRRRIRVVEDWVEVPKGVGGDRG